MKGKQWNRKGYDSEGNIKFEIKNGKGYIREYNIYGELIFEGEYLNGIKWNGKGYDREGNIQFEIKNGKGYIKECAEYGFFHFEGEYSNGRRNGKGKEYYFDGH